MAQLINEAKRMQLLAGLITESQLNEVELKLTDLGPEFEKVVKEIFGETVVVKDIDVTYRPSTDTGSKPYLYMSCVIPQTKESTKGIMLSIGFSNKEGKGAVKYNNYSKDKEATAKEFEEKLIPAFKKAAAIALGKVVKDPNQLTQSTVGGGYKYEEKDQADLDKYIAELPNLPLQESLDIDAVVNEALAKVRKKQLNENKFKGHGFIVLQSWLSKEKEEEFKKEVPEIYVYRSSGDDQMSGYNTDETTIYDETAPNAGGKTGAELKAIAKKLGLKVFSAGESK